MNELIYFERNWSGKDVMYQLKPEFMAPPLEGNPPREFTVFVAEGRVGINQTDEPGNPMIPLEAFAEMSQIVDDWKELNSA